MNLKIYEENENVPTQPVRLQLKKMGNSIILVAVDENGDMELGGNLLQINSDGSFHRLPGICPDLGFPLDYSGRLREF